MRLFPIITLLVVLLWPFAAIPQRNCFPAAFLENYLKSKFQEVQIATALSNNFPTMRIEVWISLGGSTWTIVERSHHGIMCVLRTGENWRSVTMKRGICGVLITGATGIGFDLLLSVSRDVSAIAVSVKENGARLSRIEMRYTKAFDHLDARLRDLEMGL